MFKAVRLLRRRQHTKLIEHDEFKHVIADKHKVSSIVAKHFENKCLDGVEHGVDMFEGSPKSLDSPIIANEVETAFGSFNNNRAFGYDLIPGGYDLIPGGYDLIPGGYDLILGGYDLIPGGYDLIPNKYDLIPGGYDLIPGGYGSIPGEYDSIPSEVRTC